MRLDGQQRPGQQQLIIRRVSLPVSGPQDGMSSSAWRGRCGYTRCGWPGAGSAHTTSSMNLMCLRVNVWRGRKCLWARLHEVVEVDVVVEHALRLPRDGEDRLHRQHREQPCQTTHTNSVSAAYMRFQPKYGRTRRPTGKWCQASMDRCLCRWCNSTNTAASACRFLQPHSKLRSATMRVAIMQAPSRRAGLDVRPRARTSQHLA